MRRTILVVVALFLVAPAVFPQETESRVPELEAFHEIIYPIWHTAYPEKDIAALKGYGPEVERLAAAVYGAKLPGILRDKAAKWQAGVAELRKAVEGYRAAAAGTDDRALLDAAELLHARYELLVRTIRPVLKEMDEFHKSLYVIFHKLLPEKKFDEVRAAAEDLKAKAEAVAAAELPKRLEARADRFRAAAAALDSAADALVGASLGGSDEALEKAALGLHERYLELERTFD